MVSHTFLCINLAIVRNSLTCIKGVHIQWGFDSTCHSCTYTESDKIPMFFHVSMNIIVLSIIEATLLYIGTDDTDNSGFQ